MNIWDMPDKPSKQEVENVILSSSNMRLVRIVSTGQVSPKDFWYDQEENEMVILLQGEAILIFQDRTVTMRAGDTILILAHQKHRVSYTSTDPACLWICLFYKER